MAASAAPTISPQEATVFSLQYGYPIPAWTKLASKGVSQVGTNAFLNARRLATPSNQNVVRPNVDTLYSQLFYDLSTHDLEITIPDVPEDQFKLFSFFDVFGENYASVGTGGFDEPGKYLLQPLERAGKGATVGLKTLDGENREGIVTSPNLYGILLVRWLLNQTNLEQVNRWQNETSVKTIPCGNSGEPLTDILARYDRSANVADNVMNMLPYYVPAEVPKAKFQRAGINFKNNSWTQPESVDLEAANTTALNSIMATGVAPEFIEKMDNGWSIYSPEYIGNYGTQYAFRALIALKAYLANRTPYAVYPSWTNETSSNSSGGLISVGSDEAILYTFSEIPHLKEAGFWSLTAYNSDLYLIENPVNTYALGDRSNLTYPDGQPVYFGGANDPNKNQTGPFQILIQAADVKPPANWTGNWLPSPAGGGSVVTTLRWYNAEEDMWSGSYVYPTVEKIAAIKA